MPNNGNVSNPGSVPLSGKVIKPGLLEYLCTPLSEKLASPAELLAGRQFKGLQPTLHAKLTPDTSFSEQVKEKLVAKKEMEKSQYDNSAHDLQILTIGSTVMYYNRRSKS